VFVHCLCCLGAVFSRAPGSHLSIRALGSQGRPQGPPRVPPNKIILFPIRCPIRSYHGMILLAHIPNRWMAAAGVMRNSIGEAQPLIRTQKVW
jgi:hypothetical protein